MIGCVRKNRLSLLFGGTNTPLISLGDRENGTMISASGSVSKLRDRSMQFGTRNWYDEMGRLVLSQNAKQFNIENYLSATDRALVPVPVGMTVSNWVSAYSYTLFDDIGRIVEMGELLTRATVPTAKHETQVAYNTFKNSFVASGVQREITKTYFDRVKFQNIQVGFTQENLRPRVASVTYQDKVGAAYDRATHYSYDVHGNVKNLIQEINAAGVAMKKRMDYDYDLVSGKVNYFYYQKGDVDQFIHKYEYDGDNRIVKVFTSRDAIAWDRDAKYDYYAHGPLAKTIIGEHEVQTNTFAYTTQGWIKGMNGESFSYALGFFDDGTYKDYQGIGGANNYTLTTPVVGSGNPSTDKSLYNGNVATMTSNTLQFVTAGLGTANWTQQFEYDQLNRITASSTLAGVNANSWKTSYEYDAGGNITNLKRFDQSGQQFDNMKYNYQNTDASFKNNTNKLRSVDDDLAFASVHISDIDDQQINNYTYDEIGQLTADKSEEIENIEWTVYGKVRSVKRIAGSTKPDLEFGYDVTGKRVFKTVKNKGGSINNTFYLRDGTGVVLSIYGTNSGTVTTLAEQYIYGISKLGASKPTNDVSSNHVVGQKEYELTDNLSNVRAVLSDKTNGGSPEVIGATEYLPFGMIARSFSPTYRYGMTSQEKDFEITEGVYTADFWEYDSRSGRRWNIDPLAYKYPNVSPYSTFNNSPILYNDPTGQSGEATIDKKAKTITVESKFIFYGSKADTKTSKAIADEITKQYNGANGKITVDGVEYTVKFNEEC